MVICVMESNYHNTQSILTSSSVHLFPTAIRINPITLTCKPCQLCAYGELLQLDSASPQGSRAVIALSALHGGVSEP